jgi:hypothetical protein
LAHPWGGGGVRGLREGRVGLLPRGRPTTRLEVG